MPIYRRGNSYMVSVGSKELRFRQSYKTLEEAQREELEATLRLKTTGNPLKEAQKPVQDKPKGKTLEDAFNLTWRLHWSQDKSPRTHKDAWRCIYRVIPEKLELTEITPEMVLEAIEEWEDQGNGGSTVNRKVSHLRMMFKVARDAGWINDVPRFPSRPEGKHRIRWLSEDEEQRLLNVCTHLGLDELRDFIVVAIDTGFRRGEILGLTPHDYVNGLVHLHAGETKNDKARAVPATSRVSEVLRRRAGGRKVFQLTVASLRHQWGVVRGVLKMDEDPQFVVHMLRHTCASRLVQRGVPLAVVQQWMGHSNIATTLRYAHLAPESLLIGREALEQVKPKPQLMVVNG